MSRDFDTLLASGRARLQGIETPALDARVLLCHAARIGQADLIARGRDVVPQEAAAQFEQYLERRLSGEPVSQITGHREFWGLDFLVTDDVLTPRPDSETAVTLALELCDVPPQRILDLGTGSGCLLAALLTEWPRARGTAIDISLAALKVAQENLSRLGLADRAELVKAGFDSFHDEPFDLVITNPPYIPQAEEGSLPREVYRHDPSAALFAGSDGFDAFRQIIPRLDKWVRPGGVFVAECGAGQAEKLATMIAECSASFGLPVIRCDLAGIERCAGARRRENTVQKND